VSADVAAARFAAGTRIATADGETDVAELAPGDLVRTVEGGLRAVVWTGWRKVDVAGHPRPWDVNPVRVYADAFAPGQPVRALLLSPDHAVFVGGALIPVRYLVNGASVVQVRCDVITYWHVELAEHAEILAEGLPCESYLDTGNRAAFANGGVVRQLHPDFALTCGRLRPVRGWCSKGRNAGRRGVCCWIGRARWGSL
jgi:hypothetical protein